MARITDSLIAEMNQEAETTKRVLERVPGDKLDWQPHPKSMPLGQLAFHVARIPSAIANLMKEDSVDISVFGHDPVETIDKLLPTLETSLQTANSILDQFDDAAMMAKWTVTRDGQEIFGAPRVGFARAILLNHWYHHRGQLSVYLRLLGVPVPSIYGPSADENPFA